MMPDRQPEALSGPRLSAAAAVAISVTTLTSFAVSRPLFALLEQYPHALVAQELTRAQTVAFTLTLGWAVPITAGCIVGLSAWLLKRLGASLGYLVIGILAALVASPIVVHMQPDVGLVPYATLMGLTTIIAGVAYARSHLLRQFTLWLSPAVLVFPLYFAFVSPAKSLFEKTERQVGTGAFNAHPIPVVVVVLDEFPVSTLLMSTLQLDRERFPNFSRLAESATWYPFATTNSEATVIAVPAITTGILPTEENKLLPIAAHYPISLFTILQASHSLHVHESVTQLCAVESCLRSPEAAERSQTLISDLVIVYQHIVLPTSAREHLPSLQGQWSNFEKEAADPVDQTESIQGMLKKADFGSRQNQFRDFIAQIEQFPPNTLHYLHVLYPHSPYYNNPDGKTYALPDPRGIVGVMANDDPRARVPNQWENDAWAPLHARQRAALQVGATDSLIGELIDQLQELGLWDDAVVVVVGDHGSSFVTPGSRREIGADNFSAIAGIPLFVKLPGQRQGSRSGSPAQVVDVTPTVLHALGVDTDSMDLLGKPLQSLCESCPRSPLVLNDSYQSFSVSFAEHRSALWRDVAHHREAVPSGSWSNVYGTARLAQKLGDSVNTWLDDAESAHTVAIHRDEVWSNVRLDAAFVPHLVTGRSATGVTAGTELAVGVNGRIAGYGRFFNFPSAENEFAALFDPKYLQNGQNDIRLYQLQNGGTLLRIRKEESRERMRLDDDGGQLALVEEGRSTPVNEGPPWGSAYLGLMSENGISTVRGWAGNTLTGEPATRVLVFVDGNLVAESTGGAEDPRLLNRFGFKSLAAATYTSEFPSAAFERASTLHAVAVGASGKLSVIGYASDLAQIQPRDITLDHEPPTDMARIAIMAGRALAAHRLDFETLDIGSQSSDELLVGDWYRANRGFRWAGRQFAVLLPARDGHCARFFVQPYIEPGHHDRQRITITSGSQEFRADLDRRTTHVVTVPLSSPVDPKDAFSAVVFKSTSAVSPAALGLSADVRSLSIGVTRLDLAEECPDQFTVQQVD